MKEKLKLTNRLGPKKVVKNTKTSVPCSFQVERFDFIMIRDLSRENYMFLRTFDL